MRYISSANHKSRCESNFRHIKIRARNLSEIISMTNVTTISSVGNVGGGIIYPESWCLGASAMAVVFCIFGVCGNFLTIAALLKCERLRKHATTGELR